MAGSVPRRGESGSVRRRHNPWQVQRIESNFCQAPDVVRGIGVAMEKEGAGWVNARISSFTTKGLSRWGAGTGVLWFMLFRPKADDGPGQRQPFLSERLGAMQIVRQPACGRPFTPRLNGSAETSRKGGPNPDFAFCPIVQNTRLATPSVNFKNLFMSVNG
jgi:hypothetical protein